MEFDWTYDKRLGIRTVSTMNNIKQFAFWAVFCHVVGVVLSADTSYYHPGMRVKWGPVNDTAGRNREFFFNIYLTGVASILRSGWIHVPLPAGTHYSDKLSMRCPSNDFTFCALYDEFDDFAGLQISVPVNGITNPVPVDQRISGAILWSAPANRLAEAQHYWSYQLYIVNEDSLKKTQEQRSALRARKNSVLYNDAFWVSDTNYYSNTKLRKISDVESKLTAAGYYRQGCYEGMGRHYLYDIENRRSCTDYDPWFPLTSSGGNQVHGIGFILQAIFPDPAADSGLRTWFEHQTPDGMRNAFPDFPQCDLDLTAADNLRTIHMTFINQPWNIRCTDE